MNPKRFSRPALTPLLVAATLAVLATACGGTRPYVDPLAELHNLRESAFTETMRIDPEAIEDPNVRELRTQSVEMLTACDIYSELAYENWDKKDDDLADEWKDRAVLVVGSEATGLRG